VIVSDVGKLGLILVFLGGLFVLIALGTITFSEAAPFLTLVAGYLFGNGAAAVRNKAPSSVIVPNIPAGQVATLTGPEDAPTHVRTLAEHAAAQAARDAGGGDGAAAPDSGP